MGHSASEAEFEAMVHRILDAPGAAPPAAALPVLRLPTPAEEKASVRFVLPWMQNETNLMATMMMQPMENLEPMATQAVAVLRMRERSRVALADFLDLPPPTHEPTMHDLAYAVDFAFAPARARPLDVLTLSLVSTGWAAAVKSLLRTPRAGAFWRRVLVALAGEDPTVVLHPELGSASVLRVWLRSGIAVGTRRPWLKCGLGIASGAEANALSEFQLATKLANFFCLFVNCAIDDCARPIMWQRLAVWPFMVGYKLADDEPATFVNRLLGSLQDFYACPMIDGALAPFVKSDACVTFRALVSYLALHPPNHPSEAWHVSTAQTGRFLGLVSAFAPLFPQEPPEAGNDDTNDGDDAGAGDDADDMSTRTMPLVHCVWNRIMEETANGGSISMSDGHGGWHESPLWRFGGSGAPPGGFGPGPLGLGSS